LAILGLGSNAAGAEAAVAEGAAFAAGATLTRCVRVLVWLF
jgi:hypothetical protein